MTHSSDKSSKKSSKNKDKERENREELHEEQDKEVQDNEVQDKEKKKKDKKKKHKEVKKEEQNDSDEINEEEDEEEVKHKSKKDKKKKKRKEESEPEEDSDEEDLEKQKVKMLKNLKYDFASYEIKYIYETYLKHDGEINLSPSYQREFAWNNDKQDLFIDSVMNNYIIPPIILIKLNDKKGFRYECMDGQHRLTVLKHYIESRPINPDDPYYIHFSKTEEGKKMNIFYEKKKRLENIKDKRYMTENEKNIFNDKKIIIIKISNYDPRLSDLFSSVKNEMFLRLQKGERAGGTDIVRNCNHPLIEELKKRGLISFKTYEQEDDETDENQNNGNEEAEEGEEGEENEDEEGKDDETEEQTTKEPKNYFTKIKDIMEVKTKKVSQKLTSYLFFVLKGVLVAKLSSLEIGSITDAKIRDDILNSKTMRFTLKAGQDWNNYINKLNDFLGDVSKHIETKVSQYLLILLFYNYITNDEIYNKCIENLEDLQNKFNNDYFKILFSVKEGNKVKNLFEGTRLNVAQTALKTIIKAN
jgi:hypothetical protein